MTGQEKRQMKLTAWRALVMALVSAAMFVMLSVGNLVHTSAQSPKLNYPLAPRGNQVDTYHGVEIADPYRWLEDLNSAETRGWMKAQDELFSDYLKGIPATAAIRKRIHELSALGSFYGPPVKAGGHYFIAINEPEKNQPVLVTKPALDAEARLLLDANKHFSDPQETFGGFTPSPDGLLVAYFVGKGQSNWGRLRVMDVATRKDHPEEISGVSGGVTWKRDGSGFFYIRYGDLSELEAGKTQAKPQIYFHRIGEVQTTDKLIYDRPDQPTWRYSIRVTEDGRYLVVTVREGNDPKTRIFYQHLSDAKSGMTELLKEADATYSFLNNDESVFWFYTDLSAPRGRILAIDLKRPQRGAWKEVIPEAKEAMAGGSGVGGNAVNVIGDRFVVLYRKDVLPIIRVFDLQGKLEREIQLPISYVGGGFYGVRNDTETFYAVSRLFHANTVYRLDLKTGENKPLYQRRLPYNPEVFEIKQVFYASKDGTRVPMFVAHKKGIELNGSNPVFMYGYGYGGWVAIPWFQPQMVAWMEMGGVYALPNLRGGGEYGEAWHQAGIKMNRQNAIDDFIAAAEWLIKNKYTSPSIMVSNGGSASGALAAAAVLQRPELFGAAVIDIPTLDLLRYHKLTAFRGWTRGFGSAEVAQEFEVLRDYSPYHNIKADVCYPPMLITVGERDQGAPPLHGYKFVAAMQGIQRCSNPSLLKIVWGAGHSFGTTTEQTEQTWAEQLAFLSRALKLDVARTFNTVGVIHNKL